MLLLFHGNGELAGDYDQFAELFTELGISLMVMDYRGYGVSDGCPSTSNLLEDAVTVVDALPSLFKQHACRPERVFVMGRSIGSSAALEVAHRRGNKIAGLIIESGFAFTQPLLGRLGLLFDHYDEARDGHGNARKVAGFTGPTPILHGENDVIIRPDQAKALYQLSTSDNKNLVIVANADHNNLMVVGYVPYFAAIRSFVSSPIRISGPQASLDPEKEA
jgi:alpha-beta hydrolase superfamily lysophospholipase